MELCIKSDFIDFYDNECSGKGNIYKRYIADSMPRGKALKYLQSIGIKTVDIKQVNQISELYANKVVVYTDITKHESKGKKIMTLDEAREMYPSYLASVYHEDTDGITFKYLQIGKKRFRLWFKKYEESLELGQLYYVEILEDYNGKAINLPIYSIDYIATSKGYLATDLNEVQNLSKLGIQNYISSEQVIKEIFDFYN